MNSRSILTLFLFLSIVFDLNGFVWGLAGVKYKTYLNIYFDNFPLAYKTVIKESKEKFFIVELNPLSGNEASTFVAHTKSCTRVLRPKDSIHWLRIQMREFKVFMEDFRRNKV